VAVTEGDTLKPAIDAGCAITAGNGMTPRAQPAARPRRSRGTRHRFASRNTRSSIRGAGWKGGVPARRAHAFHRVCAYAPRAPRDAIKCAGLRNDASTYRISARSDHHASQGDADSAAGFDVPQLLRRDDLRTHVWLPHRLRTRGLGNRAAAQPAPRSPSCKPT